MKRLWILTLLAVVFSGGAVMPQASAAALESVPAEGLLPHKAIYDVSLVSASYGSQILNISGQMFYQWKPSCEAWISEHRFNLYYEYADKDPMEVISDFTTYESFDGKTLNFSSRRRRDGELVDQVRGQAEITTPDHSGQAVYASPKGLRYALPAGSYFPIQHTLALLKAAKAGKKFISAFVFDGSDDEGPTEINAFITARQKEKDLSLLKPSALVSTPMLKGVSWKIRMAFFPLKNRLEKPDYEMSMILHENGVVSDMTIDYDHFSVRQNLAALTPLKPDRCKDEKVETLKSR